MSNSTDDIRGLDVTWSVRRTPRETPSLPPISFRGAVTGFVARDYLTVQQARDLGARLTALALEIESSEAETEHFDRIEAEEETPAEARMRAQCETSLMLATSAAPLIDAALGVESTPKRHPDADPDCVGCHGTGYQMVGAAPGCSAEKAWCFCTPIGKRAREEEQGTVTRTKTVTERDPAAVEAALAAIPEVTREVKVEETVWDCPESLLAESQVERVSASGAA